MWNVLGVALTGGVMMAVTTKPEVNGSPETVSPPLLPTVNPGKHEIVLCGPNILFPQAQEGTIIPAGSKVGVVLEDGYGRYELRRLLGQGGMGVVFQAFDRRMEREVVLKVPSSDTSMNEVYIQRLLREAKAAALLPSDCSPPVFETFSVPYQGKELPVLVMEFLQGTTMARSLRDFYEQDQFDLTRKDRFDIFARLCEAVADAHERGIVHRDLKPDNVMIGSNGEVRLIDWGIAQILKNNSVKPPPISEDIPRIEVLPPLEGSQTLDYTVKRPAVERIGDAEEGPELEYEKEGRVTATGAIFGTPGYLAPERLTGETQEDARPSDVFALGVIMYEWFSGGKHPFASYKRGRATYDEAKLVLEKGLDEVLGVVSTLKRDIPALKDIVHWGQNTLLLKKIEAVARKAMSPNPADRFKDVLELRDALLLCRSEAAIQERRNVREKIHEALILLRKVWKEEAHLVMTSEREGRLFSTLEELRNLRQEWLVRGREIIAYLSDIFPTLKGLDKMPLRGHQTIAHIAFEHLSEGGDHISPAEQKSLEELILKHDLEEVDGSLVTGARSYIVKGGQVPVKLKLLRGSNGQTLEGHKGKFKISSICPDPLSKTSSSRYTPFSTMEGDISQFTDLHLPHNYYVIEVEIPGFRKTQKPIYLSRAQMLEVLKGKALNIEIPLWTHEEVLEEMIVIPKGTAYLGRDIFQDNELREVFSRPLEKVSFESFAISRTPVTISQYKKFVSAWLENINSVLKHDEAMAIVLMNDFIQHLPRNRDRLNINLLNCKNWVELREQLERHSADFQWKLLVTSQSVLMIDPHGTLLPNGEPIFDDQPVHSISNGAAKNYIRWYTKITGLELDLMSADEYEIAVRGGFKWKYPWGYQARYAGFNNRPVHADKSRTYPVGVGRHPYDQSAYNDISPFGMQDCVGNVRQQTRTEAEPGSNVIVGGGIRVWGGPWNLPESRPYGPIDATSLYYGAFRVVQRLSATPAMEYDLRDSIIAPSR